MKKLHLSLFFSLAVLTASSQQVYFIYIQTEAQQPFFVTMDEKVKSSTGSGYIILSKLVDSVYKFNIGFPQNKWPEQSYTVTVGKKDHGYILKNFGDKGWGLFDLQTLAIQMGTVGRSGASTTPGEVGEVSAFTEILSKAAGDPSLREKPVRPPKTEEVAVVKTNKKEQADKQQAIKEDKPASEKEPVVVKETPIVAVNTTPKEEVKTETVTPPADKSVAIKEEPKTETKETVTIVPAVVKEEVPAKPATTTPEEKTTIKEAVVINNTPPATTPVEKTITEQAPVEKPVVKEEPIVAATTLAVTEVVAENYNPTQVKKWSESSTTEGLGLVFIDNYENGKMDTIRLVIPNPKPVVNIAKQDPVDEKKFINTSELPKLEPIAASVKEEEKKETVAAPIVVEKPLVQNTCRNIATGDDFVILRKRMASATTDDDMIAEAKKYYKSKCFTTRQIKLLGTLFLTDEGKYNFYDASYKYVSDITTFNTLQEELKDEYYATRFKAMLRN